MVRIVILLVVSALLALADGSVLQTGQVKSYDGDGNEVTDGSIKDDGYYQAGVARSYDSSRWGVVQENASGLEWHDVESVYKFWITEDNRDAGHYYNTSGDTAATYCSDLTLYSGGWRLPTIQELQTLVDNSQFNPTVTNGVFDHIVSTYYWSSTTCDYDETSAWIVRFDTGASADYWKHTSGWIIDTYVRCVRGEALKPSNLSRSGNIVTDSTTGLQWQDNWNASLVSRSWTDMIYYCENTLELGGYSDWRMPNRNELLSIVDYSRHNPSIKNSIFQHISSSAYWSSTTNVSPKSSAWVVDFNEGDSYSQDKSGLRFVRCVRGGQLGNAAIPSIIMYLLD